MIHCTYKIQLHLLILASFGPRADTLRVWKWGRRRTVGGEGATHVDAAKHKFRGLERKGISLFVIISTTSNHAVPGHRSPEHLFPSYWKISMTTLDAGGPLSGVDLLNPIVQQVLDGSIVVGHGAGQKTEWRMHMIQAISVEHPEI